VFQKACALARRFTLPVIISRRTVGGECIAGIGTFVLVNEDRWFVTAAHIFEAIDKLSRDEARTRDLKSRFAAVEADSSLNKKERRRKLAQIGRLNADDVEKWSAWWGADNALLDLTSLYAIPSMDIAIGRLVGHTLPINTFPVFKKTVGELPIGASLCRMGFPFWELNPEWDEAQQKFKITQNFPVPLFVNEGILSRMFEARLVDQAGNTLPKPPFPLRAIETSNPGLLGQSGGPIFDPNGVIWGIQTAVKSYPLDLDTEGKQYYNVGIGCHAETVVGLLKSRNVEHAISDD
jgi:hypothetical protein